LIQEQLEDLQARFAHQELAIEALNDAVLRQHRLIQELREELDRVKAQLRELRPSPLEGEPFPEPPPPHY
jgi:uncharacterized coiled-coil protein SlyX